MGLLDNFERGLERVVNGAFAKTFRSGLQPVEVGAALKRELDTRAAVVSRDRILVPNHFVVHLSPGDHEQMDAIGPALIAEFVKIVNTHAREQGFQFAGVVTVALERDDKLTDGLLQIDSSNVQSTVEWVPVLDVAGKRYALRTGTTVVGRGHEADITVEDTGISRRHLQIDWDGTRARVRDLGSTNGSQLNGQRVTAAILEPESMIQIGRTTIVFRVVPQAETGSVPRPAAPSRVPSEAIPPVPQSAPRADVATPPPADAPFAAAPVPPAFPVSPAPSAEDDPLDDLFGSLGEQEPAGASSPNRQPAARDEWPVPPSDWKPTPSAPTPGEPTPPTGAPSPNTPAAATDAPVATRRARRTPTPDPRDRTPSATPRPTPDETPAPDPAPSAQRKPRPDAGRPTDRAAAFWRDL